MSYELPQLEKCPYHGDTPPSDGIAKCMICWRRFYIPFDWAPKLNRIKHEIEMYEKDVARAKQYIALREEGFTTQELAPKDMLVIFALPDGSRVVGRNIDDLCGGLYPVKEDKGQTPINSYLGWKEACPYCKHDITKCSEVPKYNGSLSAPEPEHSCPECDHVDSN